MKRIVLAGAGAILVTSSIAYSRVRPLTVPPRYTCVQVFSYNEREYIGRTLRSILGQDVVRLYRDRFRLQVFDGGSTDGTVDIARRYGFEVYVLGRGKLKARNYSVIAFPECLIHVHLDADVLLPEYWLRNVLYHFSDRSVVAVTTPRLYDNILLAIPMVLYRGLWNVEERLYGSNSAVRHDVFVKCLFNEAYDGRDDMVYEEEYYFYHRVRRYGRIVYELTPVFTRHVTRRYLFSFG